MIDGSTVTRIGGSLQIYRFYKYKNPDFIRRTKVELEYVVLLTVSYTSVAQVRHINVCVHYHVQIRNVDQKMV